MTAPTHPMDVDCHCEGCLLEQTRRMRQILLAIGEPLPPSSQKVVPITHPLHPDRRAAQGRR